MSIVESNLYVLNTNSTEVVLYPEWVLFFIAIVKQKIFYISESDFLDNLQLFKNIAEIRYKKYIIRNVQNYIELSEYKHSHKFQKLLYTKLQSYIKNLKLEVSELYSFLKFLNRFHNELKENEKYKLMWNLEVYIMEIVGLLRAEGCSFEEIYTEDTSWSSLSSYLQGIRIYKPLYIKEHKNYFESSLLKINEVFNTEINSDMFVNILLSNEKYEDTLFYYLELIERLNANRISQDIMGALIKSIILGLEEHIKYKLNCQKLYSFLKSMKAGSHKFNGLKKKIDDEDSNDDFFIKFNAIIIDEEDSVEKYLMLYYHARNYLAHNNIDMTQFFWGDDGKRTIITNVIDAVIILLYQLETMNTETN